ncbi:MAG: sigma-54-dependent Fis family transcriptional regulator [bacterium]|nr:sigma-54-dependent Fis family transcriptional regulator [bacterium]
MTTQKEDSKGEIESILFPERPVLIVDNEAVELDSFETVLKLGGITNILKCMDGRRVLPIVSEREVECILLDLILPHISGTELLPELRENFPEVPVIVVTGVDDVEIAVECIKKGTYDYMVKPVDRSHLVSSLKRLIALNEMKRKYSLLQRRFFSDELDNPETFGEIVTNDPKMKSIFQYIEVIASSPEPVLITGETGVGKELIARVLHKLSNREGTFAAVNVAGVDDTVFSDTLFGHEKGAFTDAVRPRAGMIQTASGGTLFLDEIGDLSMASQVKLLRLFQEYEYFPLGSDIPRYTDARVILSTNSDLTALMESGRFRKDLYHRFSVHRIHIPPLRERIDDILLLVDHFLEKASKALKKKKPTVPRELFPLLKAYGFPGNIRELKAMVLNAVSSGKPGMLPLKPFKEAIGEPNENGMEAPVLTPFKKDTGALVNFSGNLPTLKQAEQLLIEESLERCGGNQSIAAKILGISRQALNTKLRRRRK